MMDLSVVPYGETVRSKAELGGGGGGGRYRECMRNHAAAIGGQAYDGCGEFMPGGEAGSLEALKCAACGCHRNFHRRDGGDRPRPLLLAWNGKNSIPPPPPPPGFPPFFPPPMPFHQIPPPPSAFHQSLDPNRVGSETPPRREEAMTDGGERSAMRKRHRTKFTAEQKEKMQAFAEKLGWRIQKHDDAALEEFCVEIGVKRHVLKVWMHNNKNHLSSPVTISTTATATAPSATSNGDPAAAPPISV